jgi:uncharacterized membrane protein YphA (DoxX/SURF4 family)/thiol-disulfide isomerase/thioredoxin
MNTALILARSGLALVFLVAGLAKLADLPGSRSALDDFGVDRRFVRVGAVALPIAELVAALLLVVAPTTRIGAVLAGLLLVVFVVGIVNALRQGRSPDCHCFGQLHSKPAGRETVARNLVLAAIAVFVVAKGPGPSYLSWADAQNGTELALVGTGFVAAVLAYASAALWRENRSLNGHVGAAAHGLTPVPVGQRAPEFSVRALDGTLTPSGALVGDERSILVFVSSSCGPCVALFPELARWKEMLVGRLGIHVLAGGDEDEIRRLSEEHGLSMLLDRGDGASRSFGVAGTPAGIEIDPSGAVAANMALGAPAIEGLIRAALKRPEDGDFSLGLRQFHPSASQG